MTLTAGSLIAFAQNYEWNSQVQGVNTHFIGSSDQISNPRLQNDCNQMAGIAIQQFRSNGGTIDPQVHSVQCSVGADGRVSAIVSAGMIPSCPRPVATCPKPCVPPQQLTLDCAGKCPKKPSCHRPRCQKVCPNPAPACPAPCPSGVQTESESTNIVPEKTSDVSTP